MPIVLTLLYKLLIGPLELFFEAIFSIAYRLLGNPGLSIVFLSLAMNFLVLPLYRRADAMQEEERERALRMRPWTDHIKKTFKGDERFMMLQTYNRQNGYKPTDALKGSLSLLLEIPFFIAAFHFLSNLQLLHGVSFGPLADLGAPDALISIGDASINLLPIVMTAINVVSAVIYMKGMPLSNKIQMYGIAVIFLVLLYASPSGLVFYWTLNNLFSLVKNIFYKLDNSHFILSIIAAITGVLIPFATIVSGFELSPLRIAMLGALFLVLETPLVMVLTRVNYKLPSIRPQAITDSKSFLIGCLFMAILTGVFIPSSVMVASPAEFVNVDAYRSPFLFILEAFMLSLGTFCIWFNVFYRLVSPPVKTVVSYALFVLIGAAIVDYLFFGTGYGVLTPTLKYNREIEISLTDMMFNILVLVCLGIGLVLILRHAKRLLKPIYACMCIAVLAVSVVNIYNIDKGLEPSRQAVLQNTPSESIHINLSKTGKNVVVIMLDRAIPYYIPYFIHEKPSLKDQFAGFTFYPNTLSYGIVTNIGSPALFGGPDYRPEQMNERSELTLAEKHDEALKLMPTLFSEKGFRVALFDPPYAGYEYASDYSIFNGIPNAETYRLLKGNFLDTTDRTPEEIDAAYSREAANFFCYSLFKIAPLFLQPTIYQHGSYNSTNPLEQVYITNSRSTGLNPTFMESYRILKALPDMTTASEEASGLFISMINNTTHEETCLQEPEYAPAQSVDNIEYDAEHLIRYTDEGGELSMIKESDASTTETIHHYQINMATMLALGEWFDYLRDNNLYDNTRIILVSDHSWEHVYDNKLSFEGPGRNASFDTQDMCAFNCLLMVKDFDSTKFTIDNQFMTNADVPSLALAGLGTDLNNPFTGNPLASAYKKSQTQKVLYSWEFNIDTNNGNTFMPGYWYSVSDDVRLRDNWNYLGYY